MKKVFILVTLSIIVILSACKKSSESPDQSAGTPLQFTSLVAADTVLKVNDATTITANASGDGLSYKWTKSYGTFIGTGATVQWFVCHQSTFTITCEVTDQYGHSATKQTSIRSYN
jgi:hypothetical protein